MDGTTRDRPRRVDLALAGLLCGSLLSASAPLLAQRDGLPAKSHDAKKAMSEGRFEAAVSLYQELVRADPDNAGFVLDLGLALHSAGRYREAVRQFEAYLKLADRIGFKTLTDGKKVRFFKSNGEMIDA